MENDQPPPKFVVLMAYLFMAGLGVVFLTLVGLAIAKIIGWYA